MLKRLVAVLLGVSLCGVMTGCGDAKLEGTPMMTLTCADSNAVAQETAQGVALRYFYLINERAYDEAVALVNPDTNLLSAETLRLLYSGVKNHSFSTVLRAVGVSGGTDKVTITYMNLSEGEDYKEVSYEEGKKPSWVGSSDVYIESVSFASNVPITDYNKNGIVDQDDMIEDDAKKSVENKSAVVSTTSTSARGMVHPMAETLDNVLGGTEVVSAVDDVNGKDSSDDGKDSRSSSSVSDRPISDVETSGSKNTGGTSVVVEIDGGMTEQSTEDGVTHESTAEGASNVQKDVNSYKYVSESVMAYKLHTLSVGVVNRDGVWYVNLPSSMLSSNSLTLQVPEGMGVRLNGLPLSDDLLDLNERYIVSNLPMIPTLTLTLENDVDEAFETKLLLTKRTFWVYDWVVPTRDTKNSALQYVADSLQSMYNSINRGIDFKLSDFGINYVTKDSHLSADLGYYYDKTVSKGVSSGTTTEVIAVRIPIAQKRSGSRVSYSIDDLKIISRDKLQVPVEVDLRVDTVKSSGVSISKNSVVGLVTLVKENGAWRVCGISDEFFK